MSGILGGSVSSAATGALFRLRPASFRGVAFGVTQGGKELGRRVVTHRFPKRDSVLHEDMGRRERTLSIEGFLVGRDIASRMRRLEAALERDGPGRLVHPFYGSLDVVVTAAKVATAQAKDLATVSITCEIYDPPGAQPAGATNGGSLIDRLGLTAVADFVSEYSSLLTLEGAQDYLMEQLGLQLNALGVSINDIASAYGLALEVRSGVAGLMSWLDTGDHSNSADAVTKAVGLLGGAKPDALVAVATKGAPAPPISSLTPSQDIAAQNAVALDGLVRGVAAAEAARAVASMDWESRDQALGYRDQVADALDDASDRAGALGWDASWRSLADLRAAMVAYVTAAAAPLPRLTHVTPAGTTSSLLLAYQLDGDGLATLVGRAADIVRRNRAPHPGFLPGGAALEVLTDG